MKNKTENAKYNQGEETTSRCARNILLFVGIFLLLLGSILVGTLLGSAEITARTVIDVLKLKLLGMKNEELSNSVVYIIWNLRLPRAILAIAAGGGLAVCGVAMQAITQNVLADPYILGVSSGASAMVSFAFFIGGAISSMNGALELFAFIGAVLAMLLVYSIGSGSSAASGTRLVLAGMAISILLNAVSQFFIALSNEKTTRSITMWMMGTLADARWNNVAIPLVFSLVGLIFFTSNARNYDLISLGDETAISMGVHVSRLKKTTMLMVALVTGIIVSSCGIIGLVGFVIPHIVRLLLGAKHRRLLPLAFLIGCVFLVWMDVAARLVMAPQELPIGIFTAFCGGPFFIWLLRRQNRRARQ